jgi:hypothetical protein
MRFRWDRLILMGFRWEPNLESHWLTELRWSMGSCWEPNLGQRWLIGFRWDHLILTGLRWLMGFRLEPNLALAIESRMGWQMDRLMSTGLRWLTGFMASLSCLFLSLSYFSGPFWSTKDSTINLTSLWIKSLVQSML